MELRIHPASGVPIYLQLMEQVKHAVETGAVRAGEQLPTIRRVAEELAMNPNTVARAYRDLEREGIIEVRHGSGAYVAERARTADVEAIRRTSQLMSRVVKEGRALGLVEPELRRIFENELAGAAEVSTERRKG
jgi:GntR family transcriptional regulator